LDLQKHRSALVDLAVTSVELAVTSVELVTVYSELELAEPE
jgi:hypothetical protein